MTFHRKPSTSMCYITAGEIPSKNGSAFKRAGDISLLFTVWRCEQSICLWRCWGDAEKMNRGILNIKDDRVPQQLLLFIFLRKHLHTYIHLYSCPTPSFSPSPSSSKRHLSVHLLPRLFFLFLCFTFISFCVYIETAAAAAATNFTVHTYDTRRNAGDCTCTILLHMSKNLKV